MMEANNTTIVQRTITVGTPNSLPRKKKKALKNKLKMKWSEAEINTDFLLATMQC